MMETQSFESPAPPDPVETANAPATAERLPTAEEVRAIDQERAAKREERSRAETLDRQNEQQNHLPRIERAIEESNDAPPASKEERVEKAVGTPNKEREGIQGKLLQAAERMLAGKNPANMTDIQRELLGAKVMMATGLTVDIQKGAFLVTPPHRDMQQLFLRINGFMQYINTLGKQFGIKINSKNIFKRFKKTNKGPSMANNQNAGFKQPALDTMSREVQRNSPSSAAIGETKNAAQSEMDAFIKENRSRIEQNFQDTLLRLNQRDQQLHEELRKSDDEYKKLINSLGPSRQEKTPDVQPNQSDTSVTAEEVPTDEWIVPEAKDAWMHQGEWVKSPDGGAYLFADGMLLRNSKDGVCEEYIPASQTWHEHYGQHYDTNANSFVANPRHAVFDPETQEWSVENLSFTEELQRVDALQAPIANAMKRLDALIASEEYAVQDLRSQAEDQNWLQHTSNALTDFDPYALELGKHEMKLSQMRSLKEQFEKGMSEADSFGSTLDTANILFRSVGMPEARYDLSLVTPDPSSFSFAKPDFNNNETWKINEQNLAVTRDAVVDTTLTVGTLGAGTAANIGRKSAQIAGRKVLGTLAKEGVVSGITSTIKNSDAMRSGEKSPGEGVTSIAIDTATGASTGVLIEGGSQKLVDLFSAIRDKIRTKSL